MVSSAKITAGNLDPREIEADLRESIADISDGSICCSCRQVGRNYLIWSLLCRLLHSFKSNGKIVILIAQYNNPRSDLYSTDQCHILSWCVRIQVRLTYLRICIGAGIVVCFLLHVVSDCAIFYPLLSFILFQLIEWTII